MAKHIQETDNLNATNDIVTAAGFVSNNDWRLEKIKRNNLWKN